jgi:rod shape-determining protein MreB and related proteins
MHTMLSSFRPILYVRIHPDMLTVRDVKHGKSISEPPLMAISGGITIEGSNLQRGVRLSGANSKVVAIGNDAKAMGIQPDLRIVNPFAHPRTPLSDFTVAEMILKGFIQKLFGRKLSFLAPTMVLHLAVELDGGITQIESRALKELGVSAGAKWCCGWIGPDLSDEQIIAWRSHDNGKVI